MVRVTSWDPPSSPCFPGHQAQQTPVVGGAMDLHHIKFTRVVKPTSSDGSLVHDDCPKRTGDFMKMASF
jgi:hypothetical protein